MTIPSIIYIITYKFFTNYLFCSGSPSHARIGFHKLSDRNAGVTIRIKRMIRHPDYKPPQMYEDIALIELVNAVTFSVSIRPACLYLHYATISSVWVSGWGTTEFGK